MSLPIRIEGPHATTSQTRLNAQPRGTASHLAGPPPKGLGLADSYEDAQACSKGLQTRGDRRESTALADKQTLADQRIAGHWRDCNAYVRA